MRGAAGRRKSEMVAKTGWYLAARLAAGRGGEEGGHGVKSGKHLCTAHLDILGGTEARA